MALYQSIKTINFMLYMEMQSLCLKPAYKVIIVNKRNRMKLFSCDLSHQHSVISIETHTAANIWPWYKKSLCCGLIFGLNSSYPEFTLLSCAIKTNQDPWLASGVYRSGFSLVDYFYLSSLEGKSSSMHIGWKPFCFWQEIRFPGYHL